MSTKPLGFISRDEVGVTVAPVSSPVFNTNISTPTIVSPGALVVTPASGSNVNVNLAGAGDFVVNTNQLYVDTSTGNVGIGTVSPIAKLEISGGNIVVGGGNGLYRNYAGSARGIIYNPSAGLTTIRPTDSNAADGIRLEDWAGNAALFVRQDGLVGIGTTDQFGAGVGVVGMANASVVPSSNPFGGGVWWVENGALKYRGSSGTVTTLAPA